MKCLQTFALLSVIFALAEASLCTSAGADEPRVPDNIRQLMQDRKYPEAVNHLASVGGRG